jgi:small subunit ribosomal protein S17
MSETNAATVETAERGTPKSRVGVVLSNKMQKTVVVQVERRMKHGKYGKYMTQKKKYKAHDETNACKPGDTVRISETRPLSREKRWRVAEILEKATEV